MSEKQVALELAAFLDSAEAGSLALEAAGVRKIAESFLVVCYDVLGKKPRLLDDHDVRAALLEGLPAHLRPKDPLAEHVPAVLEAFFDHLESSQVVTQAYEIRRGLAEVMPAFLAHVRAGENTGVAAGSADPFVHGAAKLGRNDPCSCGSGKKFKKCHGKNA